MAEVLSSMFTGVTFCCWNFLFLHSKATMPMLPLLPILAICEKLESFNLSVGILIKCKTSADCFRCFNMKLPFWSRSFAVSMNCNVLSWQYITYKHTDWSLTLGATLGGHYWLPCSIRLSVNLHNESIIHMLSSCCVLMWFSNLIWWLNK